MDCAPVIAINFMRNKVFLYFSGLSRGGPNLIESAAGNANVDRSTRATNKGRNLNVLGVMLRQQT